MSISKDIKDQVQAIMSNFSDEKELEEKLLLLSPTFAPTSVFSNAESDELELAFITLTVQDILDTEFYYAFLVSKPISKDSEIISLKYGEIEKSTENIDLENYHGVMDSRDTLVCVSEFNSSFWNRNNNSSQESQFEVKISGQHDFKLGEKISIVCARNPKGKQLTFIRKATPEEIIEMKLDFDFVVSTQQIDFKINREILVTSFQQFLTDEQATLLLLSLISEEPMFFNCHNISAQIEYIMPRVCNLRIKAPFRQSLFPYKNTDGKLIQGPMQMNINKTFVVLDFSQFSDEKETKIDQSEIDNLKALKMFVEEGKTVYRWEFGESLNDHIHSGVIVQGSKIINPHFYVGKEVEKEKREVNPFSEMKEEELNKMRVYVQKCLKIEPSLSEDSRNKIEKDVQEELDQNPKNNLMIQERMQISKLNAKSYGRDIIEHQDYLFAKQLLKGE